MLLPLSSFRAGGLGAYGFNLALKLSKSLQCSHHARKQQPTLTFLVLHRMLASATNKKVKPPDVGTENSPSSLGQLQALYSSQVLIRC